MDKGVNKMKFHDAVRKHIKVLDSIQKKLRTKDGGEFLSLKRAEEEAKILKEEDGEIWIILDAGFGSYDVIKESNMRKTEEKRIVKRI